jgi:hypothetical protein
MKQVFPSDIKSLDRDWLTRALLQSKQLESGTVSDFSFEKMDGGYTSSVYRLSLNYQAATATVPESVVIKFHSDSRSIRETFELLGIYQKEVRFYQFIDPALGLPIPEIVTIRLIEDRQVARR